MKSFKQFISPISESFKRAYKASEEQFNDLYPHRKVKRGIVTSAYNSLGDEVATYTHNLGVLSTNRKHDQLKPA